MLVVASLFVATLATSAVTANPPTDKKPHIALLRRFDAGETAVKAWVFFTDKGMASRRETNAALDTLAQQYDRRAAARRARRRTSPGLFDEADLPVHAPYVRATLAGGAALHVTSRWLNAVSVTANRTQFERIARLPFVRSVQPVRQGKKIAPIDVRTDPPGTGRIGAEQAGVFYGRSQDQLAQMNLIALHDLGYTGAGVVVGVLDTGFERSHPAFNDPTHPLQVVAEWDFVDNDPDTSFEAGEPSSQHNHGTWILGTMGAYQPGELVGAAYDASFILCKTEDVTGEYPAEEDNYVAGLEFVEANGGDMVTSSLGYIDWYTQADLDGLTAVTTIVVNAATANGVHCLTAAGNEGHDTDPATSHLIAPADAPLVMTCGAVDESGLIAGFSSDGPTADGRIKPELLALGVSTATVSASSSSYSFVSGTSLSTPLVAGAVACLVQALPGASVDAMRARLLQTAGDVTTLGYPDPLFVRGYGVVNALAAWQASDCNENGIDDAIDIATGTSPDVDGNGIPDECECPTPPSLSAEPDPMAKNRYLSFVADGIAERVAIRVTTVDVPAAQETLVGQRYFVGPPIQTPQAASKNDPADAVGRPSFVAAETRCEPYYADWSTLGTIHVLGRGIVPGGTYHVQAVRETCPAAINASYSLPLALATSRWGDLVGQCSSTPCSAPDGIINVSADIVAILDKFMERDGAVVKVRADIEPALPDRVINISDAVQALDAFSGGSYTLSLDGAFCP